MGKTTCGKEQQMIALWLKELEKISTAPTSCTMGKPSQLGEGVSEMFVLIWIILIFCINSSSRYVLVGECGEGGRGVGRG